MKKYKLRIIVPINTDNYNQYVYDSVKDYIPANVELDIVNISGGSKSIECRYNLMQNEPYVVEEVRKAEVDGIDGIFVTDMDFCGVEVSREVTDIPIIGGFRANTLTAISLGEKFSIITILDSVKEYQIQHVREFGLLNNFASIVTANINVESLAKINTDPIYKAEVVKQLGEQSLKLINEDGADSIIFGCTAFINVADGVHQYLLEKGYDVPVLDPNRVSINFLYTLVSNKLKQSRKTYSKYKLI